ncbi:MAG: glutaminyl-peptide cyclotransferase [Chitinivibrionales bacterium]|nr:glutaminyl-peptide cyclotransferase [Chitinivibrionales bacterium]
MPIVILIFLAFVSGCYTDPEPGSLQDTLARVVPEIIDTIPHDTEAFTQGLLYHNGFLYESTGKYGTSSLRKIDPSDGTILVNNRVPEVFAEGLAVYNGRFVQLTWRSQSALLYDTGSLAPVDTFSYRGEGWGLTTGAHHFIMSNGSDTLYFRDNAFMVTGAVQVTQDDKPLARLNELEYARGLVYANVWFSNYIFEIDLQTGSVLKYIDCTDLVKRAGAESEQDVLNGVAYDKARDIFYLTGKNWSTIFVVKIPRE